MKRETNEFAEFPNQLELVKVISARMAPLLADKDRFERANKSMLQTLTRHLGPPEEPLPEIAIPPEEAAIGEAISAYMAVASMQRSLSQVEYYFRRFPFNDFPVSRGDHLRNVCEMYFDRVEQFRQRLKALTDALKKLTGKADPRYGATVKALSKLFRWEQKQRNRTHHERSFEYDAIDQLGLIDLLRYSPDFENGQLSSLLSTKGIYRQEVGKWVGLVRNRSEFLENVVEAAAGWVLEALQAQTDKFTT